MLHLVDELTGLDYPLELGPIYHLGKANNIGNGIIVPYTVMGENDDALSERYGEIPHIRNISRRISRRHCQIIALPSNAIRLIDTDSANGTYTSEGTSIGEALFRPGGRFFLGNPENPGQRKWPGYPMRLLEAGQINKFRREYAAGNI